MTFLDVVLDALPSGDLCPRCLAERCVSLTDEGLESELSCDCAVFTLV